MIEKNILQKKCLFWRFKNVLGFLILFYLGNSVLWPRPRAHWVANRLSHDKWDKLEREPSIVKVK